MFDSSRHACVYSNVFQENTNQQIESYKFIYISVMSLSCNVALLSVFFYSPNWITLSEIVCTYKIFFLLILISLFSTRT